jgi:SAM-dependent methyltransferase
MNQLKEFWETCDTTFAHVTIDKHLKNYKDLTQGWDKHFLAQLNAVKPLSNTTILDYGIGGGYLGIHMYSSYNINKYIGIDISERQLKYAKHNLQQFNINYELLLTPVEFKNIQCDIFISQAVIQHFPDVEYLNNFLTNLNSSDIPFIMLQIRYNKNTLFTHGNYNNIKEVVNRCHTNNEYIGFQLNKYNNMYTSIPLKNNYQFLFYQIKS